MSLDAGPETDCLIQEHVFGYRVVRVTPEWYGREVVLFYPPGSGLIEYSYDDNACNALMYRNGVDSSDGTADSLPFYSEERGAALEVVDRLVERGLRIEIEIEARGADVTVILWDKTDAAFGPFWRTLAACESDGGPPPAALPLAICRAALSPAVLEYLRSTQSADAP